MAEWKDFTEIVAWQRARALLLEVDKLLKKPEVARDWKFRSQLSDAARSGPRNIAEGFARFSNREFARFVRIAKGSEAEVINHLIDARDQGLINDDELTSIRQVARRAIGAAVGLIQHLETAEEPFRSSRRKGTARNLRH